MTSGQKINLQCKFFGFFYYLICECQFRFSSTLILLVSGGKECRCVGLTTLPPSCADCLKILELQTPETTRAFLSLWRESFTFTFYLILIVFYIHDAKSETFIMQCTKLFLFPVDISFCPVTPHFVSRQFPHSNHL